jgi:two-component system nitrogen regulation response regulator GlnG
LPLVLVVDDEALIRWSLSEGLNDAGFAVRQAASGAEASSVVESTDGQPLVILLDLRLPDVADLSLLQKLRARRPDAPMIVMTAHGTPADLAQARTAGVSYVVDKPFDVAEMVTLVRQAWAARA